MFICAHQHRASVASDASAPQFICVSRAIFGSGSMRFLPNRRGTACASIYGVVKRTERCSPETAPSKTSVTAHVPENLKFPHPTAQSIGSGISTAAGFSPTWEKTSKCRQHYFIADHSNTPNHDCARPFKGAFA